MRIQKKHWQILGALAVLGLLLLLLLPVPKKLTDELPVQERSVLDRNGELLAIVAEEGSGTVEKVDLGELPESLITALITTEDRTFYRHPGISARGIARAAWRDIQTMSFREGGSTLTQQYVRLRLGRSSSILGKLREMYWALKVERVLTKDEILERFFNTASFGGGSVGIAQAARNYFGKAPQELSLAESAFLVGVSQSPTSLDPRKNLSGAKARQERILDGMVSTGAITDAERNEAVDLEIKLNPSKLEILAPHFVYWVLSEYPNEHREVHTTLDLQLQRQAEAIIEREVEKLKEKRVTSAAAVVLNAENGEILAMVGSRDYFDADIDGAVNVAVSARQPGSALKPFTYALALARGDTAATIVADTDAQFLTKEGLPYTPRNYDFDTHGPVPYREALGNSYNIAAVRVLEKVGVESLLKFLRSIGITTLHDTADHYGLALTLGSGEVTLLELANAYGIFPRGGKTLRPKALLDEEEFPGVSVLDPRVAWVMNDILSDSTARMAEFGVENPLNFSYQVAAKTGTTRNSRDNWVIGYSKSRIVGVWVGNADNTPMLDTSGVTGAGPIFHALMDASMERLPKENFERPSGIVERDVCKLSGKLATALCPGTKKEVFVSGTEPKLPDDTFRELTIDSTTNLLATDDCVIQEKTKKVFAFFPIDVRPWAREHGWPDPPSALSPRCRGNISSIGKQSDLEINSPSEGDTFRLSPMLPPENQKISFEAVTLYPEELVTWVLNGETLGTASGALHKLQWEPLIGNFVLESKTATKTEVVRFEVEPF